MAILDTFGKFFISRFIGGFSLSKAHTRDPNHLLIKDDFAMYFLFFVLLYKLFF